MKALEFENIHRAYERGTDVLKGVTFSVDAGEVVGLLGKNGAGKTTLIRIAMGMLEAQSGRTRVLGLDPRANALEMKRRVGYVSEDQVLPDFLSVGEVLRLHRSLFPGWDSRLERSLIDRFALPLRARIRTLSKGQARQVALLCAIAHRPEALLLDEPAGGLDPAARREFLETSIRLLNESGTTILFSSHHMTDVERMAGRIVMIHEGSLLLDGSLDDLREQCTLALVPDGPPDRRLRLLSLGPCISVRAQSASLRAVVRLEPEQCRSLLEQKLDICDAHCVRLTLEDLFVELVEGRP